MPAFIRQEWNGYQIAVLPSINDSKRKILFAALKHELIPYLWGAKIYFDLSVVPPSNCKDYKLVGYKWELYRREDKNTIKTGKGTLQFLDIKPFIEATSGDMIRGYTGWVRKGFIKLQAINLGYISITDQYRLIMQFSAKDGTTSEEMPMAEFTIKDRDDFYTQILWALIGATLTVLGGIITTGILYAVGVI